MTAIRPVARTSPLHNYVGCTGPQCNNPPGGYDSGVDDVTIDSEGTPLSVDESLDLGGGVWRYVYGSDGDALAEGTLTVTLVAGEVADLAGNVNLEATETFTYQPPPLSQIVWGVDAEGNEHQAAMPRRSR